MEKYELTYKIKKDENYVRILGEKFFKRNIVNGHFIYNNKRHILKDKIETKNIKEDKFSIIMIFLNTINNKSSMFKDCDSLIKFSIFKDKKKEEHPNIQTIHSDISPLYDEENSILFDNYMEKNDLNKSKDIIDDFSSFINNPEISNYSDISSFKKHNYSEIEEKENDSKKSTIKSINNILENKSEESINLSKMFYNCSSLLYLSDISEWDTEKVFDIHSLFYNCSSLTSLPDISKWNIVNVYDMNGVFDGCSSLLSLPDISRWNTNRVTDMGNIFKGCSSLSSLPDISRWNTNKNTNMNSMFSGCSSLLSLPDISKWNTKNVENMGCIFLECSSLSSLPDISKWNNNNTNMNGMLYGCSSLVSLPDISKWNTSKVIDIQHIL